jgi:hypothetical protein
MSGINSGQAYHTRQTHFITAPIVWNQGTGVRSVGWLPPGAIVIGGGVHVNTAFVAGGANTVDVGFRNDGAGRAADDDAFGTLIAVATNAGFRALDELTAATNLRHPRGCEVTVRYNGTTPSAGEGTVVIEYIVA